MALHVTTKPKKKPEAKAFSPMHIKHVHCTLLDRLAHQHTPDSYKSLIETLISGGCSVMVPAWVVSACCEACCAKKKSDTAMSV